MNGSITETLNPKQAEAVEWCDGPELVLAGAGSGKTRVLTAKIAYLVREKRVPPHRILALTFTNKAAKEMLDRVKKLVGDDLRGMQVSTFHSYGLRFLYRNAFLLQSMGYPPSFVVFDRGDARSVVKKTANALDIDTKVHDVPLLMDKISRARALCDPQTLEPDIEEKWRELYDRYRETLVRQGAVDFDDLLALPLHILSTNPDVLDRERAGTEWVLVDEYQDVNVPQHLMLKRLVSDSGRLMVVGDPDQSIYGWRGADMSLILAFEDDFPGARVFVLDQNYRSSGNILDAANSVIRNNPNRRDKNLWTASEKGPKVKAVLAKNDIEEMAFVVDEIERLSIDGYDYGEMSILYRMNALSRGCEKALLERGIPYRIVRGVGFYDRKEVKDILSMLRLAVNPKDRVSLDRIANVPVRGLGKKGTSDLGDFLFGMDAPPCEIWERVKTSPPLRGKGAIGAAKLATAMLGVLREGDLRRSVDFLLYDCGYEDYLREECPDDWEERMENVQELLSLAPEGGDLLETLAEIALVTDLDNDDGEGSRVNLLTLHAAKGLEFPVVFLVGFEEGVFPGARSIDEPGGVEEERRLCYVGMTRARERLYLSGVMSRLLFGEFRRSLFSRFLLELPDECTTVDDRTKGGGGDVRGGVDRRRWRW